MYVIHAIDKFQSLKETNALSPVILTIGNFEGVHLGHQALLKYIVDIATKQHKTSTVLTFSNHPSEILRPGEATYHLTTTDHKLKLLERLGINLTILLPFTKEFSEQTAEKFLLNIRKVIPFDALILGSDAHFGKNRDGDRKTILNIAQKLKFDLDYFPDFIFEHTKISSSKIRSFIQQRDLSSASSMLGRPYSIYGKVLHGSGRGALLGFPTANIAVEKLCLPPKGVYSVILKIESENTFESYPGVANIGNAPTINKDRDLILEVHLFEKNINLYGKTVEVELQTFIREEMRFDSIESLKKQITEDVIAAKKALASNAQKGL